MGAYAVFETGASRSGGLERAAVAQGGSIQRQLPRVGDPKADRQKFTQFRTFEGNESVIKSGRPKWATAPGIRSQFARPTATRPQYPRLST